VPTLRNGSQIEEVILSIDKDWEMNISMELISTKAHKVRALFYSYRACFAFKPIGLEGDKGKLVKIQLEDDHPLFRC